MWHKPQLMTALADLLVLSTAAVMLVTLAVWVTRLPLFPLREVVLLNELQAVQRSDLERALGSLLHDNFFNVKLDPLRQSLEQLPWVRRAEVRRHWPGRIEIRLEEQQAVAYWGEEHKQRVNRFGEVFTVPSGDAEQASLPTLNGPNGRAAEMLLRYQEFSAYLAPIGYQTEAVNLSPRLAWQLKVKHQPDNTVLHLELGREQNKVPISLRVTRFAKNYPALTRYLLSAHRALPSAVDMRYPNGFALRFAGSSAGKTQHGQNKQ
ncbi:MAG: cell division protein FtsQ/DivIB [Pseudomonadota bacterium]